jgi:hypothetical protein
MCQWHILWFPYWLSFFFSIKKLKFKFRRQNAPVQSLFSAFGINVVFFCAKKRQPLWKSEYLHVSDVSVTHMDTFQDISAGLCDTLWLKRVCTLTSCPCAMTCDNDMCWFSIIFWVVAYSLGPNLNEANKLQLKDKLLEFWKKGAPQVYTYMPTYIHTYIHTYIRMRGASKEVSWASILFFTLFSQVMFAKENCVHLFLCAYRHFSRKTYCLI